jgi:hypothetical protein
MTDLLPCPFCGGNAVIESTWFGKHSQPLAKPRHFARCTHCKTRRDGTCDTKHAAACYWNKRKP